MNAVRSNFLEADNARTTTATTATTAKKKKKKKKNHVFHVVRLSHKQVSPVLLLVHSFYRSDRDLLEIRNQAVRPSIDCNIVMLTYKQGQGTGIHCAMMSCQDAELRLLSLK